MAQIYLRLLRAVERFDFLFYFLLLQLMMSEESYIWWDSTVGKRAKRMPDITAETTTPHLKTQNSNPNKDFHESPRRKCSRLWSKSKTILKCNKI